MSSRLLTNEQFVQAIAQLASHLVIQSPSPLLTEQPSQQPAQQPGLLSRLLTGLLTGQLLGAHLLTSQQPTRASC